MRSHTLVLVIYWMMTNKTQEWLPFHYSHIIFNYWVEAFMYIILYSTDINHSVMMRKENKLQAFNIEAFSLLALPRVTRWIASCQTHTPSLSLPRAKSLAASSALNHPAPAFILWDWQWLELTAALIVASLLPVTTRHCHHWLGGACPRCGSVWRHVWCGQPCPLLSQDRV